MTNDRDRKDRDGERWTERGYREREKTSIQKGQKEIEITREKKGEKLRTTQRKFHLFLFHFFKEMKKDTIADRI